MKTILVDMDNTIADYSTPIAEALAPHVKEYKITSENWSECVSDKSLKKIQYKKQSEPNFFRTLKPIDGAIDALNEMEEMGFIVFIVSSPCIGNSTCHSDKSAWLKENMGEKWARRLVLTKDKTIVLFASHRLLRRCATPQ
jgi:5'-nucleotidase